MPTIRPFTAEELQELTAKGYDMSQYKGEAVEIPDDIRLAMQQTTALGAGTRSALASAIPTAAGGAGFAGAMALLAPETMGASLLAIPVAAGAGYLASKVASKGQEVILPESIKQSLAIGEQEHPVASRIGSLAALPFGGFRLDPSGFVRAASGAGKLATIGNQALSIGERQAVINAAASGALGGVQEVVMAPIEGHPITAGNVALGAAIGATHTAPMKFAQKYYGFRPITGDTTSEQFTRSATLTPEQIAKTKELRKPIIELPQYALGPEQLLATKEGTPEWKYQQRLLKEAEQRKIRAIDFVKAKSETLEEEIKKGQLSRKEQRVHPLLTELEKELYPDYTGVTEHDIGEVEKESATDLEARRLEGLQDKYQKEEQTLTPEGASVQQKLPENIAWTPEYQKLINPILERHGFKVEENGNLVGKDGTPLKGQAVPGKVIRTVINPLKASLDTPIHEGFHGLQFLAEGGNKPAAELLARLNRASDKGLKEYNDLRALAGKEPMTMEEFTATQQGFEFVKQAFNLEKEGKWQKWWNDTKALFKTKYGKESSVEDLRRAVNYRIVNDPRFGGPKSVSVGGVSRNQPTNEQIEWLRKNNKVATGVNSQDYNLPSGLSYGDLRVIGTAGTDAEVTGTYNNLVELNPELKTISIDKEYNGPFSPKQDIINGVASKFKLDNIKYFVEDLKGTRQTDSTARISEEGAPQMVRNQPISEGLTDKNQLEVDIAAREHVLGGLNFYRNVLDSPEALPQWKVHARNKINELKKELDPTLTRTPESLNQPEGEGLTPKFTKEEIQKGESILDDIDYRAQSITTPPSQREKAFKQKEAVFSVDIPELNVKNQPESEGLQQHYAPGIGSIRPTEASFDRVTRKVDKSLGAAFNNWRARKEQFTAIGTTALQDLKRFSPQLVDQVEQKMSQAYRSGADEINLSTEEQPVFDVLSGYYQKMRDIQNALGLTINGRVAGSNPFYVPHQLNDTMLDLFSRKGNTPEAQAAKREWAKHVEEVSDGEITFDEALDNIHDFVSALSGQKDSYKAINFGAVRKAAGYGLPDNMRELNTLRSLDKYSRRASNDLAMYSELESNPEIANKLELKDPNTGMYHPGYEKGKGFGDNEPVRDAMKWVTGNWTGTIAQELPRINAIARLVNAALLGPVTGVRNVLQVPVNMVPYVDRFSDLGAVWKGLQTLRDNRRAALETGATIPQIDKIMMNDLAQSPDQFTASVQKAATLLRKWQGSEAIENFQRDLTFSIGKELAKSRILSAAAGDVKATKWLDKFGLLVEGAITKLQGPELEAAINQTAKNFVDRNQGTYSGSGLPAGVMESQFAPFLALQKWSIEKSNVIYQDVFKPFMTGENRLPLLTYTLGTFLTGAAIQKINELITNRKAQDPTWQEALDSGNPKQIIAELSTLMQLGSYAGIVSDGLKLATDISLTGKTPRNIVSFPTATAILNTEEKTRQMAEALRQGENPWEVLKEYTLDLAQNQVQVLRVLLNHTLREENVERSDKFRDLRVFNELQGSPRSDITASNPYLNLGARQFKRATDIQEATQMLPGLVTSALEESKGEPEKIRKSLVSLSGNSYQTMPSFENSPMTFQQYYQWLVRNQGQEAADKRMQDFIRQSTINKIKSSLVPRL